MDVFAKQNIQTNIENTLQSVLTQTIQGNLLVCVYTNHSYRTRSNHTERPHPKRNVPVVCFSE